MRNIVKTEPALVTALAMAVLGCAATFGVNVTADQRAAICGVITAAMAICGGVTRAQVTPNARAQAITPEGADPDTAPPVAGPASPLPTGTPVDVTPSAPASVPDPVATDDAPKHAEVPESDETTDDAPASVDLDTGELPTPGA